MLWNPQLFFYQIQLIWCCMEFSLRVIFSHLHGHLGQFSHFLLLSHHIATTSCQLTIEFIAMLNDNYILQCVIVSFAMLFLC